MEAFHEVEVVFANRIGFDYFICNYFRKKRSFEKSLD